MHAYAARTIAMQFPEPENAGRARQPEPLQLYTYGYALNTSDAAQKLKWSLSPWHLKATRSERTFIKV